MSMIHGCIQGRGLPHNFSIQINLAVIVMHCPKKTPVDKVVETFIQQYLRRIDQRSVLETEEHDN